MECFYRGANGKKLALAAPSKMHVRAKQNAWNASIGSEILNL